MFVGHYGVSFAFKSLEKPLPLWLLFIAVQFVDVLWAVFVPMGIEKVRITPGITASNPFDLYYMPYSHSLVAALLWSGAAFVGYKLTRSRAAYAAFLLAAAVFSCRPRWAPTRDARCRDEYRAAAVRIVLP